MLQSHLGWIIDRIKMEQDFNEALEKGYAFERGQDGKLPQLYALGNDGKPDPNKPLSQTQLKDYYDNCGTSVDKAALIIKNGYMPSPSIMYAYASQFVKLLDNVRGPDVVDNLDPNIRSVIAGKLAESAGARHSEPAKDDPAKANAILQQQEAARNANKLKR